MMKTGIADPLCKGAHIHGEMNNRPRVCFLGNLFTEVSSDHVSHILLAHALLCPGLAVLADVCAYASVRLHGSIASLALVFTVPQGLKAGLEVRYRACSAASPALPLTTVLSHHPSGECTAGSGEPSPK